MENNRQCSLNELDDTTSTASTEELMQGEQTCTLQNPIMLEDFGHVLQEPMLLKTSSVDKVSSKACQSKVRPMDVVGILMEKRIVPTDSCADDVEGDSPNRSDISMCSLDDLDLRECLLCESEEVASESSNKQLRKHASSAGPSASDLPRGTCTSKTKLSRKERQGKGGKKSAEKSKVPKRPSPNAFVSMRVPSPSIRQGLEEVQKWMVEKDPDIKPALTSLNKLHITLSVIRLENEEEQERYNVATCTRSKCDK